VTAGTCETWTVTSFPPFSEHPFHSHTSRFMITHIDGVEVEEPFWRDTFPINGFNFTAHICFDALEPGDSLLTHCHMPSHLDIGMGTFYRVVAGAEDEPSSAVFLDDCLGLGCCDARLSRALVKTRFKLIHSTVVKFDTYECFCNMYDVVTLESALFEAVYV
jgi:hypothetical protein